MPPSSENFQKCKLFALLILLTINPYDYYVSASQYSLEVPKSEVSSHITNSIIESDQLITSQQQQLKYQQVDMSNDIHMAPSSNKQVATNSLRRNLSKLQHQKGAPLGRANKITTSTDAKVTLLSAEPAKSEEHADKWTVEIRGGPQEANQVAKTLNCINLGLVKGFQHIYLLEKKKGNNVFTVNDEILERDKRDFRQTAELLRSHKNVVWVEPQTILTRVKRSHVNISDVIEQAKANRLLLRHPRSFSFDHQYVSTASASTGLNERQQRLGPESLYDTSSLDSSNINLQQSYITSQTANNNQRQMPSPMPVIASPLNSALPATSFMPAHLNHHQPTFHPSIQYSTQQLQDPQSIKLLQESQQADQFTMQSERKLSNGPFIQMAPSPAAMEPYFVNNNQQPIQSPPNHHYYQHDKSLITNTFQPPQQAQQAAVLAPPTIAVPSTTPRPISVAQLPVAVAQNKNGSQPTDTTDRLSMTKSTTTTGDNKPKINQDLVPTKIPSAIGNHHIGGESRDIFSRGYSPSGVSNEDRVKYDDELWMHQWYMQDNSNNAHMQSGMHLHVQDVWNMGYTGKNVVVTVIDDGIEWNHTDLIRNYDPLASYDMNNNDPDPFPRYDAHDTNSHGTRCAGEIAMVANNKKCGVGVAPNARIGGIKSLDGDVSDIIESMSLIHNLDHIDIYSGSWGPKDDGMTLEGPKQTTAQALKDGIERGRQGKGALYVWANGNGGISGDNCNCDGYVSSLYTLAVGSVTQKGQFPFYGERCASTLAVTCSSGSFSDKKVTTTDLHNRCTTDYSGTSAAAPLAAGILALVLEANPNITWRDAQHLVAWNSEYYPLRDNTGWFRNRAGLMFNNKFGFGLMNAKALVDSALTWQNVPQKSICTIYTREYVLPEGFSTGTEVELPFYTDGCERKYFDIVREKQGKPIDYSTFDIASNLQSPDDKYQAQPINYLEHVQIVLTIEYPVRGDIDIFLTSPSGTTSNILTYRPMDKSRLGFTDWAFMSVHFWGERPHGTWILRVRDKNRGQLKMNRGYLVNATLILHGTTTKPDHMNKPRIYDGEDQIKDTLEKSTMHLDMNGRETYDENPWDQNMYPNEMSQVSSEVDEEKLVTSRMLDSAIISSLDSH